MGMGRPSIAKHVAAASIAAATALVACGSQNEPCGGVAVGSHLKITVVDYYTGNLAYDQGSAQGFAGQTCNFGLDVAQGQVLDATVTPGDYDPIGCYVNAAKFAPFGKWTWTLQQAPGGGFGAPVLDGVYDATDGVCQGTASVELRGTVGDLFAPVVAGQVPPAVLSRAFMGGAGNAGCPSSCNGDFVVSVQRVQ